MEKPKLLPTALHVLAFHHFLLDPLLDLLSLGRQPNQGLCEPDDLFLGGPERGGKAMTRSVAWAATATAAVSAAGHEEAARRPVGSPPTGRPAR